MFWSNWLTLVSICILGAMSPGPSLAVVLKNTLQGHRLQGSMTALGHGLGIGFYAFLSITGLALAVTQTPWLFSGLQILGAIYLGWMGLKSLLSSGAGSWQAESGNGVNQGAWAGFRSGFMISFFNPKVAVFFIALFSQFIGPDSLLWQKLFYATTAAVIDAGWYLIVVLLFTNPLWLDGLRRSSVWLERIFAVLLLVVSARLIWNVLA